HRAHTQGPVRPRRDQGLISVLGYPQLPRSFPTTPIVPTTPIGAPFGRSIHVLGLCPNHPDWCALRALNSRLWALPQPPRLVRPSGAQFIVCTRSAARMSLAARSRAVAPLRWVPRECRLALPTPSTAAR